jgi:hypothetical protein
MKRMTDLNEVPQSDRLLAYEKAVERQKNILSMNKDFVLALDRLSAACDKDVDSLVGREKLKSYTDFRNELRAKFLEIPLLFKATSEGMREEKEYRRKLVAEGQQFFKGLGLDKKKVEDVLKSYIKKASEASDRYLPSKEEAAYVITDPAKVPTQTHNPWTFRYPPYDYEWGMNNGYGTTGSYLGSTSQNRYTGQIGAHNRIYVHSHKNSDFFLANSMSEIGVWYKMPATGMVEAWLYLQNIYGNYDGSMEDESGISDVDVKQQSWPYMEVLYPQGAMRTGILLDFHMGEYDCSWSGKIANANPGDFRYVHLFSTQSYVATQWVYIAFGIFDHNYVWVDDYSVELSMTNRWFMHNLAIRSTGAQ